MPINEQELELGDESKQAVNLKIKDSLIFSVRKESSGHQYILEDSYSEKYFRIGLREYSLIIQLDGETSLGDALYNANLEHDDEPLSEEQASQVLTWLLKENLLDLSGNIEHFSNVEPTSQNSVEKWVRKLNVIFFRLPLLNPDAYLDRLLPKLSWLVSKPFLLLWALILLSGIYHITAQWARFEHASLGVFYPLNWLWLIVGYVVIKTSHELFHGLVSKYYGGAVNEAGVIFVLFIPIGYVNATSSWHFPSKWQRFHTAVAGMFIELLFAGIACWVWAYTDKGPLNNFAYNMIIIASVSTLLFNANPLMRFDGYFALSDLLNIPNLYARGRQYVQFLMRKYLLAQQVVCPETYGISSYIIKTYGVASAIWRIFIILFILVAAYSLFYGAGIVLACIALLSMVLPPLIKLFKTLKNNDQGKTAWGSSLLRLSILVILSGVIFTQIPWSRDIIAPGVIDYEPAGAVKAEVNGFVNQVNVRQGEQVKAGQVLAVMVNKELEIDLEVIKNQLASTEAASRIYLNHDQLAQYKIEKEKISAYQEQLALKSQQVSSLIVRSPIDGKVVTNLLARSIGQYAETGQILLHVGNPDVKRIYVTVLQKDQYDSKKLTEKPLEARVVNHGHKSFHVKINQETPRAYKSVRFPQLSNTNGGPLTVVPVTSGSNASNSESSVEYIEPRSEIIAVIAPEDAKYMYAGQIARVRLPSVSQPLGKYLFNKISNWVNHLFDRERW